jgi:hypothetical protein
MQGAGPAPQTATQALSSRASRAGRESAMGPGRGRLLSSATSQHAFFMLPIALGPRAGAKGGGALSNLENTTQLCTALLSQVHNKIGACFLQL